MNNHHIVIACRSCGGAGSVAAVACRHATELTRYFRVTLVSDTAPPGHLDGVHICEVAPQHFGHLRRFCHVPNEYSFTKAVRRQLQILHESDSIDVLMCHSHALATLAACYLKKKYGIPYALITHGDIFDRPQGTYDFLLTLFYRAVTPRAYKTANLILALSPYMASCALKRGAMRDAIKVVPNGIDSSDIGLSLPENPIDSHEAKVDQSIKLLFVGSLTAPKGVDVLLKACDVLRDRAVDFSLDIIGDGPLKSDLLNQVDSLGLSQQIRFLGKKQRKVLGGYYLNADLVCLPSLSEPQGIVVLEALISGTPVIGSDVGGIPFMVEAGRNGLLVPPRDAEAIANAVEHLYQHVERLEYLRQQSRPSVLPRFSWNHIGEEIRDHVREVIANSGDSR